MNTWDVIVIGAGPAGIFAALELTRRAPGLSVLVLDKGLALEKRKCPSQGKIGGCLNCSPCSITSGWGGAGAFSDGKLTLTNRFGGFLDEHISKGRLIDLIGYIDKTCLSSVPLTGYLAQTRMLQESCLGKALQRQGELSLSDQAFGER